MSRRLAEVLSGFMRNVIQGSREYLSPDIEKGVRWGEDLAAALEECNVGIVCLTPENLDSTWIMFEAGALSKTMDKARVSPVLFSLEATDVKGPLAQFQATRLEQPDVRRLMQMINSQLADEALEERVLEAAIERWWPDLEKGLEKVRSIASGPGQEERSERDLLLEVLQLTRSVAMAGGRPQVAGSVLRDLIGSYRRVAELCARNARGYDFLGELWDLAPPIEDIVGTLEMDGRARGRLVEEILEARRLLSECRERGRASCEDPPEDDAEEESVPF